MNAKPNVVSDNSLGDILVPFNREATSRLMRSVKGVMINRSVATTRIDLSPGERLPLRFDRDGGRVYLIDSGAVSLEHFSPRGRRTILDILPPNDFFGEDFATGVSDQYSPTAFTEASLTCVDFETFQSVVREIHVYGLWRQSLMLKSRRHRSLLLRFATSDCETRLALRLFDMAFTFSTRSGREMRIDLRLRHEDYAAMVSTTRSRIGFFLQRFADRGMLRRTEDGLFVIDPPTLVGYIMERVGLSATAGAS